MDDNTERARRSELRQALQLLTKGDGVLRDDLVAALQGDLRELQRCWRVNVNDGSRVARQTVILNLEAHIDKLSPRTARQDLSPQGRRQQYEHAMRVCFNLPGSPELQGKDLTGRQAWLDKEARGRLRIDESTCRRDLRDALDQIERQILEPAYQPVQIGKVVDNPSEASGDYPSEPELATELAATLTQLRQIVASRAIQVIERFAESRPGQLVLSKMFGRTFVAVIILFLGFVMYGPIRVTISSMHPSRSISAQLDEKVMNGDNNKWLSNPHVRPGDRLTIALTIKGIKTPLDGPAVELYYNPQVLQYVTDSIYIGSTLTSPGEQAPYGGSGNRIGFLFGTIKPGQQIAIKFEVVVSDQIRSNVDTRITSVLSVYDYKDLNFPAINVQILGGASQPAAS